MVNARDITQEWDLSEQSTEPANKVSKLDYPKLRQQYDSTVGNRTIKGPDSPDDYTILDIPENGKRLVLTWGQIFVFAIKK